MGHNPLRFIVDISVLIIFSLLWYFHGEIKYKNSNIIGSFAFGTVISYYVDCLYFQNERLMIYKDKIRKEFKFNIAFILKVILINLAAGPFIVIPELKEDAIYTIFCSLLVAIGFIAKVYQSEKRHHL